MIDHMTAGGMALSSAEEQVLDQGRYAENQQNEDKEADQTHPPHQHVAGPIGCGPS